LACFWIFCCWWGFFRLFFVFDIEDLIFFKTVLELVGSFIMLYLEDIWYYLFRFLVWCSFRWYECLYWRIWIQCHWLDQFVAWYQQQLIDLINLINWVRSHNDEGFRCNFNQRTWYVVLIFLSIFCILWVNKLMWIVIIN
jgi:hypothetical protein